MEKKQDRQNTGEASALLPILIQKSKWTSVPLRENTPQVQYHKRGEEGGGDKKKKEKKRISEDFAEEYEACFTHHCLPKNSTNCTARERPCLARMQQWLQQGHWCLAPAHLTLWLLWNTEHISNTEKTESSSPELCTERRHYRLQMTEDRQTGMRFTNSMLFSTMHFQCRFWKVFLSTPHIYSWKSPLETT